jgi:FkbM family methyltransferase
MLIPLDTIVSKYNIKFNGILHVGAHECEEIVGYDKYLPRNKVLWIEAIPEKVDYNRKTHKDIFIEQAVVSDKVENINFNISNNGQSSSILDLELHKIYHPHIHYVNSFQTETKLLKDIICNYDIEYNFLNFDIQGAELKALKGMEEYLPKVDYLYTEVNSDYVYKGCALVEELDEYLQQFQLYRVETEWTEYKWGDALYIRK